MHIFFHQLAMAVILLGSLALLYLASVWFIRGNMIMGFSMLIMSLIALSNFYLHALMMKGKL